MKLTWNPALAAASLLCVAVTGCSFFGKKPVKTEPQSQARLVGKIASKPPGADYALIESYGIWTVPVGGLLTSAGSDGRAATLVASGEKLSRFTAADIKAGTLEPGDAVFYKPSADAIAEAKTPAAPAADSSKTPASEPPKS